MKALSQAPKAKKRLGQHWLYDVDILEHIVQTADINHTDFVLEVGPGTGTLTEIILMTGARVTAVEFDQELYGELSTPGYFPAKYQQHLKLVNQDILKFDLNQLPSDYKIIANIPYYLTSNLIRIICDSKNAPVSATLLIQKEVAERVAASSGEHSILSVITQMYFEPCLGKDVPAELFTPPPKVDSKVLHLERRNQPLFRGIAEEKLLVRLIKAGFSSKRKKILNSLSAGMHLEKSDAEAKLKTAGISSHKRAEALDLKDWIELARTWS